MLPVSAYVGYDKPIIRQALEHLRSAHDVLTGIIEERAAEIAQHAVFATSPGNYPGHFLKTLFATTPTEQEERSRKIAMRGYTVPEFALKSSYLILLKVPASGTPYAGEELVRFHSAVDFACGFSHKKPRIHPNEAERRRTAALTAHHARKRDEQRDNTPR